MGSPGGALGWAQAPGRAYLSVLVAGTLLKGGEPPAPPLAPPSAQREGTANREEEVFLFALRLDQTTLSAAFPGFPVKDGFLLPLGELCRLLDLAVQVDPSRGSAEGFIIGDKRRFRLDVLAGQLEIQGARSPVDRSLIELHTDDIYVDSRLLSQWLPVDLDVVKRSAVVTVIPREPLPLQLAWKRQRESGRARPEQQVAVYPRVPDPYLSYESPFVDETLQITARSRSGSEPKVRAQSTTFATGDYMELSTSLYAAADSQGGLSEFRVAAGRRDPNAGLLGPLQATEFAVGEVLNPGLNLLVQPYAGTGALLTNFPLQQQNAFDRHSFQGDLPPGWQVELYRNQALLAFRPSRPDGRYEFLDIPLFFGWNDFRMVFYGPQGQRREEAVRFDLSENQTPKGAFHYRLVGDDPVGAGPRGQFEARYGISKQLAASFALARVQFDGRYHTYTEVGFQGFWQRLSASFTAASDSLGGAVEEVGLRTRVGSVSLMAKRDQLQGGFSSEIFPPSYGLVRSRSNLEASALLPSLERAWFTLDVGAAQDELVAGGQVDRIYCRLSTSYQGYFLSNGITRTEARGGRLAFPAATTGDLLASKFFRTFSLRGQADYQMSLGSRLNSLALMAETPLYPPFLLRAGITRTLSTRESLFLVGANKDQGAFSLGLDLSYSTQNRFMANLILRMGLGRDPRQGRVRVQAQGLANQGAVSARAFLDRNGNGILDSGEKGVEAVGFLVNGASHPRTTDARGVAFLTNLGGELDANLAVASASLEDPLMRPGTPGIRVTPRPGHVAVVDFPLVLFGEVNGTAFLQVDGGSRELPGLGLELVAPDGKVIRRIRTAYDGYYTCPDIPPGQYQMKVPAIEARRFGVAVPPPLTISIGRDGTVIDGLNLLLRSLLIPKAQP